MAPGHRRCMLLRRCGARLPRSQTNAPKFSRLWLALLSRWLPPQVRQNRPRHCLICDTPTKACAAFNAGADRLDVCQQISRAGEVARQRRDASCQLPWPACVQSSPLLQLQVKDAKNGLTLRSHNIFGAQTQSGRNQAAKTFDTGALGRRCTLRLHARWCLTTGRPSEALCRERRNF